MYRQRRIKGGRENIWGGLEPHLKEWVLRQCEIDDCSASLVVSNAISFISGLPIEDSFRNIRRKRKKAERERKRTGR